MCHTIQCLMDEGGLPPQGELQSLCQRHTSSDTGAMNKTPKQRVEGMTQASDARLACTDVPASLFINQSSIQEITSTHW